MLRGGACNELTRPWRFRVSSFERRAKTGNAELLARGAGRGPAPCNRLRLGELHRGQLRASPRGCQGGSPGVRCLSCADGALPAKGPLADETASGTPLSRLWPGIPAACRLRGTGHRRRSPLQVGFAARRPLYRGGHSGGRSDRRRRPNVLSCQRPRAFTDAAGRRGT